MIFNSLAFLCFALVLVPLFWALRSDRWRHPLLFVANFLFYGWWDWRFCGLLFGVVALSWGCGIWISRAAARGRGRTELLAGCTALLAILGYFKYTDFFISSANRAFSSIGIELGWTTLNILLPAGVSFYIFQAISYLASVAQNKVPVEKNLIRLGVYLGFFPHLVAGPIIRAHQFLPQLASPRVFDAALFWEGTRKFAIGFLYKAVFADNIAHAINPIWSDLPTQSGASIFGGCSSRSWDASSASCSREACSFSSRCST